MDRKLQALGEIKRLDSEYDLLRDVKIRPRRDHIVKALELIKQYIVENKLIIYGGTASRFSLKKSNDPKYDEAFDPRALMDLDFMSPTPLTHAINITKLLSQNGYKPHIENAMHNGTFKIKSDFHSSELVDASYVHRHFYNLMPYDVDEETKIRHVKPDFQIVNLYKMMIDPMRSWFKLEKQYLRVALLEKHFLYNWKEPPRPPRKFKNVMLTKTQPNPWIVINDFLKERDNILIVGQHAYNLMMEASELPDFKQRVIPLLYPTVIVKDTHEESFLGLADAFMKDYLAVKRREFYSFLEFFIRSYTYINVENDIVMEVLVTNVCMPFEKFDGFMFGSFHVQIFTLYVKMWHAFFESEGDKRLEYRDAWRELIYNLQYGREYWLQKNGKIGVEEDAKLLRELQGDCIGEDIPSQLETMFASGKIKHVWKPGQPEIKKEPYFPNHAGRERSEITL
jgi:hypothetical protein